MTTNAAPGGEQPIQAAAPAEAAPAPVAEQPTFQPQPGAIPPPGIDPNTAVSFYQSLADPQTRNTALERTLQTYGILPDGASLQQVQAALQLQSQIPDGITADELIDYAREIAEWQANPFAQQAAGQPQVPGAEQPQQQYGAPPIDPAQLDAYVDRRVQAGIQEALQAQQAHLGQQEMESTLSSGFQSMVAGMNEHQAQLVEAAIVGRVNGYIGQGHAPSAQLAQQAMAEVQQQLAAFAPVAGAQQVGSQQQVAPQTTMPQGAPQGGNPQAPGIEGAAQAAYEKLAQMGYNIPTRR